MNEGLFPVKIQATDLRTAFLKGQGKEVTFSIRKLEVKVSKEILRSICVDLTHLSLKWQPWNSLEFQYKLYFEKFCSLLIWFLLSHCAASRKMPIHIQLPALQKLALDIWSSQHFSSASLNQPLSESLLRAASSSFCLQNTSPCHMT